MAPRDLTVVREPAVCADKDLLAFARLVREGFDGSDDGLTGRVREASWLAFHHASSAQLVAIAGLKVPEASYREAVFEAARSKVGAAPYECELGWVYVCPGYRGRGLAGELCRRLLALVPADPVFATTRPDNSGMMTILRALGFTKAGKPYRRREEELVLFVRAAPS